MHSVRHFRSGGRANARKVQKRTMDKKGKQQFLLVAFGVALYAALMNLNEVAAFLTRLVTLFTPVIIGLLMAFVLSVPMQDGVSRVEDVELAVEDVEFQRELPNRRVIEILHDKKVMRILAEHDAVPRSIHSEPSFPSEASTPARCAFVPFSIADDHRRAKGRNADFPQKSARKKQRAGETTKQRAKELAMQRKPFYN